MDNFTKGLMERNEMRNKALGISATPSTSSILQKSPDKENKRLACNIRKDPAAKSSPRKSNQQNNNEIVRSSNANKTPVKVTSRKEDADVAVEINITSSQNIQVEVEVAECEIDENGKFIKKNETTNSLSNYESSSSSSVPLSEHSRRNLKRLGVLYSETDQISSPIQRTEENFCEKKLTPGRPLKKFTKLAALADDINSWDDDYSQHAVAKDNSSPLKGSKGSTGSPFKSSTASPFKSSTASPFKNANASPFKKAVNSPSKTTISKPPPTFNFAANTSTSSASPRKDSNATNSSPKKLVWDKKVMDSLEAQGFSRRESTNPKLVYDYASEKPSTSTGGITSSPAKKTSLVKPAPPPSTSSSNSSLAAVMKLNPVNNELPKPSQVKASEQRIARTSNLFGKKDPAEMSLKERMAIFEKNKGKAPVPATQFGIADANPIRSNLPELSKKYDFGFKKLPSAAKTKDSDTSGPSGSGNIKQAVSQLLTKKVTTISEKQISDEIRKQRDEDMKCIMSRYNKQEDDDDENMSFEEKGERKRRSSSSENKSPKYQENDINEKRARMSATNAIPARLYPVLSDIETTDSEMDNYTTATVSCSEAEKNEVDQDVSTDEDDQNNTTRLSIGRELLNTVRKYNDLSNHSYLESTASSIDVSDALDDMDDYLNEALEDDSDSKCYDDKGSAYSDSFEYARYPASGKRVSFKELTTNDGDIPIKSRLEISPAKSPKGSMTLVHTVSFYRRQQTANSASNTPIKKVVHRNEDSEEEEMVKKDKSTSSNGSKKAREESELKIQRLLDEVMRQQAVIKQTSQALNLCAATFEFSGSSEAVEGERHLLVATHRRLACLNEVQRLKYEGVVDRTGREKGTLSIQEIIVPLKQTYISRLASDEINGHHLLCLVKYNEYVLATKTLPTLPGLKSVKFTDSLIFNEVFADFKITLEIYGMTAQREVLPHDIKYHIQTPNKKKFKSKIQESNLVRPPIQSPGGPNAVRTPALVQYGYIIFSLREIKQKSWVINETAAGVSPLNGNVYLKIDSKITVDINHSGFLTIFDDISGFGAWHRRWCRLSGTTLYFWKYPEDEKKKDSLGQIDLTSITSERATLAPRTICSRLHTILLESKRERRPNDTETLVTVPTEKYTLVRHLLAADTKEEREEWCDNLNKSLSLLKSWGNSRH